MSDAQKFILRFGLLYALLLAWSLGFERPEFRPWELVKDPDTPYFFPSRRVEMTEIGDLAFRSWIRELADPRETVFSTDRFGFRNPEDMTHARIVALGDSYVAGAGLRDDETFAVRLGAELGEPVYSVAVHTANSPSLFLSERRFEERPPELVVFLPSNRLVKPLRIARGDYRRAKPQPVGLAAVVPALARANEVLARDNGLTRSLRMLYNGALYRLRGYPGVIEVEGRPALALPLAEQLCFLTPEQRDMSGAIASALELARILSSRGTRMIYAPIPDSAEVYPELFPPEELARCAKPSLFDRLIPEARAAGLEVVDLRAELRAQKARYLYRLDDSHWAPHAVEIAARAVAQAARRAGH
jgi:hypothetical protein